MKYIKLYFFFFIILVYSNSIYGQNIRQFNGQFTIISVNAAGGQIYDITGLFTDPTNVFSAAQVKVGDRIIDPGGNTFEILTVSASGSEIVSKAKAFDAIAPYLGLGVIFRPTSHGFPLISINTPSTVLTTSLNAATVSIDNSLSSFSSGKSLPVMAEKNGDVILNTADNTLYQLTTSGWTQIPKNSIPLDYSYPVESAPHGNIGDVIISYWDDLYYVFDGSSWKSPRTLSSLPESAKFGDVFYVTSEKKLYMMNDDGDWANISSSSFPGGTDDDLPDAPEPGDLFFNTEKNTLYMYDINSVWVEVSTNGSNPAGIINPDPAHHEVKPGNLFFNTQDKRLYVFNGISWNPTDNLLPRGQVYVGNSANVATPVPLTGDATIATNGILTIADKAITDKKLDKDNIPLSGFGLPVDDIVLGDDITKFKISNLANPTVAQDAATKGYVDNLFATPSILALPKDNFFVGNASNRAVATPKSAISLSGFGPATTIVSLGNNKLTSVADPTTATDAATKNYVDTRVINPVNIRLTRDKFFIGGTSQTATEIDKNLIPISGFGAAMADVSFGDKNIINLKDPINPQDAATKNYVDQMEFTPSKLLLAKDYFFKGDANGKAEAVAQGTISLSGFGPPEENVSFGDKVLSNLGAPTLEKDAATKGYVDALFGNPDGTLALSPGDFFVGDLSGMAKSTPKYLIPISGFGKAQGPIDMGVINRINFLQDPIDAQDAATKNYVDEKTANPSSIALPTEHILIGVANQAQAILKGAVPVSDFGHATAPLELGKPDALQKIVYLADPESPQDAATKAYVDSKIAETPSGDTLPADPKIGDVFFHTTDNTLYVFDGTEWKPIGSNEGGTIINLPEDQFYIGNADNKAEPIEKNAIPLSGFGTATDTLSLGNGTKNFRIANLADPIRDQDAATKAYVDSKGINSGPNVPAVNDSKAGDIFYNSNTNTLYVFNGTDWMPLVNELAEHNFYIGDNSNRPVAIAKENISISGFGIATDTLSLGNGTDNFRIANLGTPIKEFDAVTKKYVDDATEGITDGFMKTDIYDIDKDGIVDNAATVNFKTIESDVPENAVFTDDLVKVGETGTGLYLSEADFEVAQDVFGKDEIVLKKFDISKFEPISDKTMLGNISGAKASPEALTGDEVKNLLDMSNVDNTRDLDKHVLSASKLDPPIMINGNPFDGSADFTIDGDDLGNHIAEQNITLGNFSISRDGGSGGLSFDDNGHAIFAQDVTVKSNFYTPSDQRLKTNIQTLTEALESLNQLRGVRFEYLDQQKYMTGPKVGLIAQDLQKVYPEMVSQGSDGFLKVDYTQLSAVLIQAIKEQQEQLSAQAKEIEELKNRMDKQEDQLNSILQKLAE